MRIFIIVVMAVVIILQQLTIQTAKEVIAGYQRSIDKYGEVVATWERTVAIWQERCR